MLWGLQVMSDFFEWKLKRSSGPMGNQSQQCSKSFSSIEKNGLKSLFQCL